MDFWQGKLVRLRGIEPSDGPLFHEWNRDSERARQLDFVWPPISCPKGTAVQRWADEQAQKKLEDDAGHQLKAEQPLNESVIKNL